VARVTHEDRKHASQFMTMIMRQAYGGNMLVAEHALAKLLADERERVAKKLEEMAPQMVDEIGDNALIEAAKRLRGDVEQPELEEQPNV
jgi:truncated hemoglobin YjbI